MTFQPALPLRGLQGWALFQRSRERQENLFNTSYERKEIVSRFESSFEDIRTIDDLTKNRAILQVVLGAFGLQDDLRNTAFIRKVISDGVNSPSALANRLSDKRYFSLAKNFEYLVSGKQVQSPSDLSSKLIRNYLKNSFEVAVGNQNVEFRQAMTFERDLSDILNNFSSDRARWFAVLGSPPLRRVLETALGLPKQFAQLPIDQQVDRLKNMVSKSFNVSSIEELAKPEQSAKLVQRFLIMSDLKNNSANFSPALFILGGNR